MTVIMSPEQRKLREYTDGFRDGAALMAINPRKHSEEYDRGYGEGRSALRKATAAERERLGLPAARTVRVVGATTPTPLDALTEFFNLMNLVRAEVAKQPQSVPDLCATLMRTQEDVSAAVLQLLEEGEARLEPGFAVAATPLLKKEVENEKKPPG